MDTNITPERRRELADQLGLSEQYLYQCLTGRREMRPAEAMRVELASGGVLTRRMLCTKTYADVWPELIDAGEWDGHERRNQARA